MTHTPSQPHPSLVSVLLLIGDPAQTLAIVERVESLLTALPHEILLAYGTGDEPAIAAIEGTPLGHRLRLIKSDDRSDAGELRAGFRAAAGDVIIPLSTLHPDPLESLPALAQALRDHHAAIAIASSPRAQGTLHAANLLLGSVAGIGTWNSATGLRAYSADFLNRHGIQSTSLPAATLELAVKAQFDHEPIIAVQISAQLPPLNSPLTPLLPWLRRALLAPLIVWSLWLLMAAAALLTLLFTRHTPALLPGLFADAALPASAAFAFILAVRRVRGRTRIADSFFPLVLLNPLLFSKAPIPYDQNLLAAGLLGLMAGAIIAMKHDNYLRYLAVAVLALALTRLSDSFLMLLPALGAWLIYAAYTLARSPIPRERSRGFAIMIAAEIAVVVFALACILVEPTPLPRSSSLFPTIVSFAEFPLLVLAIVMLALGWRKVPGMKSQTPPYFWGMLALLVGLLAMLLNNFQAGSLPPPGADQTVLILCLVYTVFALHGPRRLHWLAPPILLILALTYTLIHRLN